MDKPTSGKCLLRKLLLLGNRDKDDKMKSRNGEDRNEDNIFGGRYDLSLYVCDAQLGW